MNITNVRKPVFCNPENKQIRCEIELNGEWLPFVASPSDCTEHGKQIFQDCVDGKYGEIKAFIDTFDIVKYKELILNHLSIKCYEEAEKILPQSKQINIMIGGDATANYPDYLKGDSGKTNVGKFVNIYQTIYHNAETAIMAETVTTKAAVDEIIETIVFPTGKEVLSQIL